MEKKEWEEDQRASVQARVVEALADAGELALSDRVFLSWEMVKSSPEALVLRLSATAHRTEAKTFYAKVCTPPPRARLEFDATFLRWRILKPYPDLKVPRPVLCLDDEGCLVTEGFHGSPLARSLKRASWVLGTRGAMDQARFYMRQLAQYRKLVSEGTAREPEGIVCAESMFESVTPFLELCSRGGWLRTETIERLRSTVHALAQEIGQRRYLWSSVNRDLSPGNILTNGSTICVVDLGSAAWDHHSVSLLTACATVAEYACFPYLARDKLRELQETLIEPFTEDVRSQPAVFKFFELATALRLASYLMQPPTRRGPKVFVARQLQARFWRRELTAFAHGKPGLAFPVSRLLAERLVS